MNAFDKLVDEFRNKLEPQYRARFDEGYTEAARLTLVSHNKSILYRIDPLPKPTWRESLPFAAAFATGLVVGWALTL